MYNKKRNIPIVKTTVVRTGSIINSVSSDGIVRATQQTNIIAKTTGIIKKIHIKDGEEIKEGELLIELDDEVIQGQIRQAQTNLSSAELSLQQAKIAVLEAQNNLTTTKELFKAGAIAREQVELVENQYQKAIIAYKMQLQQIKTARMQLEQVKKQLENIKIYSPISGYTNFDIPTPTPYFTSKKIKEGDYVTQGQVLLSIINKENLQVHTYVDEVNIKDITVGQNVEIKSEVYTDKTCKGYVTKIGEETINKDRLPIVEVLIDITRCEFTPKINSEVEVEIITDYKKDVLLIPNSAIVNKDNKQYVYKISSASEKKVNLVEIKMGLTTDDEVEIIKGLVENDIIVLSPPPELQDNQSVKFE